MKNALLLLAGGMILAVAAKAVEHQVVGLDSEIFFLFEGFKERGYNLVLHFENMVAVEAYQVVMGGGSETLVHGGTGADIGDRDQLVLNEINKRAVDCGEVKGRQTLGELLVDLSSGKMFSIGFKDFEYGFSGGG